MENHVVTKLLLGNLIKVLQTHDIMNAGSVDHEFYVDEAIKIFNDIRESQNKLSRDAIESSVVLIFHESYRSIFKIKNVTDELIDDIYNML